ncbi:Eburicol 14-alpha-demethylase [Apiospora kogelbergensis]|uniref:Eburicol 14-alpha-demethylase n=1 Tax=Apiospora kogelbergensis TaxID=1337665 RepID=A0AAW0QBT0_9PEZI
MDKAHSPLIVLHFPSGDWLETQLVSISNTVWYTLGFLLSVFALHIFRQLLPRSKSQPPTVFHLVPYIGNAVAYGTNPRAFYERCRAKHGDLFTFILFGKKITMYLGIEGNEFILNGKLKDLNAEEIYGPLTTPVFGSGVVYDCPNAKLMEQKKFIKFGLTQKALESYVPLIEKEVRDYMNSHPTLQGANGIFDISAAMSEITLYTAGRTLQGAEVRKKLTAELADLYHDLEQGFQPINFIAPWLPLPQNRRRDKAHAKMCAIYMDVINERRRSGKLENEDHDMIGNLMNCVYKDGKTLPDLEIAKIMITLMMAGQHSSSSSSAWIMLRLASRPDIVEELYQEQYADLDKLTLMQNVIKETLRLHGSIHIIMRKVTQPLAVPGTDYVIKPDKVLGASPLMTHCDPSYFPDPLTWDPHRWDAGSQQWGVRTEASSQADTADTVDYGYGLTSRGTRSPYLPFGAGRHRCIGEKFAFVNLQTIVATFVREMRFAVCEEWEGEVPETDYSSMFSKPEAPSVVEWTRRNPSKKAKA